MIQQVLKENKKIYFAPEDYLHGAAELNHIGNLLYAIIYHYEHSNYPEKETNLNYIKYCVSDLFKNKMTPTFVNSHNWGYSVLCQSFALIKHKNELWNLFTTKEQKQITQCMRMFLFMWNFGCNADNWYNTGWGLHGKYNKFSNSNYELTNNMLLPFLVSFFEDNANTLDILNSIVLNLDWEAERQALINLGFDNAAQIWGNTEIIGPDEKNSCSTRNLIEQGGRCFIKSIEYDEVNYNYKGFGKGVKIPIKYDSRSIFYYDDIAEEVVETVLDKCFSKICTSNVVIPETNIVCGMPNNILSPYEGQPGMMLEFDSTDVHIRSSVFHCSIDFVLSLSACVTLKLLGIKDITLSETWPKIKTGIEDYLFKKEHNYQGYSMGRKENYDSIKIDLWKNYWETHYR